MTASHEVVQTNGGKQSAVSVDTFETTLTFTFSDGRELSLDAMALPRAIQIQAMVHGLKQKLIDAAAIPRDPVTGHSASVDDKYNAILGVYERLTGEAPAWNAIRASGEGSAKGGLLMAALLELTGKTKAEITLFLESKSGEEKAALRKNPKIAEIIARLQAAKPAKPTGIDSDSILNELVSGGEPRDVEGDEQEPSADAETPRAVKSAKKGK